MVNKLNTYIILILVINGLAFLGIGCSGKGPSTANNTSSAVDGNISVKGPDTILPLIYAEAEAFMNQSSGKIVSVTGGGSDVGIAALIDGQVDIAYTQREVNAKEIENANKNGVNLVQHTITYEGITAIVNPENPVSNLSFVQLRGIYVGNISNWKDVGGEDRPIAVISGNSNSETYAYFKEDVLNNSEFRPDALATTKSIASEVSQNPGAIGYISFAYSDNRVKALSLDIGTGSVPPTSDNIKNLKYPLSRPLYMYTNGAPTGLTKEFIDFVTRVNGQTIVAQVGYIPLSPYV